MSPYYTELLETWAASLPAPQQATALLRIALKKDLWERINKKQMKGPALINPILDLAKSVVEGRITVEYACQAAARPEFFVELMFPMVNTVCDLVEQVVLKNWRPAVAIMKIALASLDARRSRIPENQQAMDLSAVESWLAVVTRAIADVPDGRIYHDAVKRGDAFADIIDPNRDPPGQILHRLGVLHLDPYVAGRVSSRLEQQLQMWQTRLEEEYGTSLAGIPEDELHVPPIEEALPKAVEYFRRAAAVRGGVARGRTLKALAQALFWEDILELPVDAAQIVAAAQEALLLLARDQFPAEFAEMSGMVERFQGRAQASADSKGASPALQSAAKTAASSNAAQLAHAREVLATSMEEWVERAGRIETLDLFAQSALSVRDLDPALALQLWTALDGLMQDEPEPRRRSHLRAEVDFVKAALVPEAPRADGSPVHKMVDSLNQTAKQQHWNRRKLAYALLCLAFSTTATDQEEEGLGALEAGARLNEGPEGQDPLLATLLPWAHAEMTLNNAVNAYNRGDFAEAARRYSYALRCHLEVTQPLAALDILRRLLDLARAERPEVEEISNNLLASLAEHSLELELAAGNAATYLIQTACRKLLALFSATGSMKLTVVLILLDVAKGRRFGAAVAENAALPWLQDPQTFGLEKELAQLRGQAEQEVPPDPTAIDEETLLAAYVSPSQMRGGANASEQLRNLQIRFDTALDRHLSSGKKGNPWVPQIETVQELLDDTTVLMVQYIGMITTGETSLTTLLIGKQESAAGVGVLAGMPVAEVVLSEGEEQVSANLLSLGVSALRSDLRSPPGPRGSARVVDSRATVTLEEDCGRYLGGGLQKKLAEFRSQGKTHLCICAHGPLHYYPFHLLGPEDQPLAAEWRVTYLPNLRLLSRIETAAALPGGDLAELTAIGVNFGKDNPHRLPQLDDPEPGAEAAARIYGASAIVGSAATEDAVINALTHSRRVHISTHGRHNVSAPAFQCLYVQPDTKNDGIIYAYELLRLDLRQLDLVTLSACETALGRFDIADNLRGIPAALLIAGVRTIVGTLWRVESSASKRFFEVFYTVLKSTGNKLEAFSQAQKQTRKEFPEYRDWGAFQMIGAWQ